MIQGRDLPNVHTYSRDIAVSKRDDEYDKK